MADMLKLYIVLREYTDFEVGVWDRDIWVHPSLEDALNSCPTAKWYPDDENHESLRFMARDSGDILYIFEVELTHA